MVGLESANNVETKTDTVERVAAELNEGKKQEVANKVKLPTIASETHEKQQSGIIEEIPENMSKNLHEFVNDYVVSSEYSDFVEKFTIAGGSNDEEFKPGGDRQKGMENDLAKIFTSLGAKGYNWIGLLQQLTKIKNINIPNNILNGAGSLDEELNKITDPKKKSDFLNEWLALGRMFKVLDVFDKNQIQAMQKSLKMGFSSKFHEGSKKPEDKYSKFIPKLKETDELSPSMLPPSGVKFTFTEISHGITDLSIGMYSNTDYRVKTISGGVSMLHKTEKGEIIFDQRSGGTSEVFIGDATQNQAKVLNVFAQGKDVGGEGSTMSEKYAGDLNEYAKDFDMYRLEKDSKPSNTPMYNVNILANKINENHWLNQYFDIKRENMNVAGNTEKVTYQEKRVVSIQPKFTTGNKVQDHLTALNILARIYDEQKGTSDQATDQFVQQIKGIQKKQEDRTLAYNKAKQRVSVI